MFQFISFSALDLPLAGQMLSEDLVLCWRMCERAPVTFWIPNQHQTFQILDQQYTFQALDRWDSSWILDQTSYILNLMFTFCISTLEAKIHDQNPIIHYGFYILESVFYITFYILYKTLCSCFAFQIGGQSSLPPHVRTGGEEALGWCFHVTFPSVPLDTPPKSGIEEELGVLATSSQVGWPISYINVQKVDLT